MKQGRSPWFLATMSVSSDIRHILFVRCKVNVRAAHETKRSRAYMASHQTFSWLWSQFTLESPFCLLFICFILLLIFPLMPSSFSLYLSLYTTFYSLCNVRKNLPDNGAPLTSPRIDHIPPFGTYCRTRIRMLLSGRLQPCIPEFGHRPEFPSLIIA